MLRTLGVEFLDTLPSDSRDAKRSRQNLIFINRLMGNWRWMDRRLAACATPDDRLLELGAGGGESASWLRSRRAGSARPGATCGLDLAPRPQSWPAAWDWFRHDLVSFARYGEFDVVIANLTLHHCDENALVALGRQLRSGPRVILAVEPVRKRLHLWQAHMLRFCGVNRVTRHDAPVSVRAGFRELELPRTLGLAAPEWDVTVEETWRGAYRMAAVKSAVV